MKTKIKKYNSLLVALALVLAIGATTFASYGSSGSQNDCPNPNGSGNISCTKFHNDGYTGADGSGGDFPRGTTFATFNGYKDQKTNDGRRFDERQFLYIESENAQFPGLPDPEPWHDDSNYNFGQGTSYTINFTMELRLKELEFGDIYTTTEQQIKMRMKQKDTHIKFSNWSKSSPQEQYKPRFTISGRNTRPTSVWADVTINGSQPFTLTPVEGWFIREDSDGRPGTDAVPLSTVIKLTTLTTSGATFKSNINNDSGIFESSELHYAKIYLEFEATPSESGVCHSLTIDKPEEDTVLSMKTDLLMKILSLALIPIRKCG